MADGALSGATVLVTGATGFIGGALSLRLVHEGAKVRALSRSPQKGDFLRNKPNIELVHGNITHASRMQEVTDGCQYVFHAAAAFGDWKTQYGVNVEGTRNVMNAALAAGVRRVVHISTISFYGYRRAGNITEAMTPSPSTTDPYSRTKASAEGVVREVCGQHDLSHAIIRPAMVYGPRSNVWTETAFKVARLKPTPWIGDGSGHAHPVYIDDVVDMLTLLATHPQADGEAFNCAPDPPPTWRQYLGLYSKLAGHQRWMSIPPGLAMIFAYALVSLTPAGSRFQDVPEIIHAIRGSATFKMDKARTLLGWTPKVDLQTGIANCAPWLREQGLLR